MPAILTDFGLAKATTTGSKYTRTGQALGTPAYMSPEQARGEVSALTPATDVWSLGCILYDLLAGRRAFDGETPAALLGNVLFHEPEPLRRLHPGLPEPVERVVRACLSKHARHRIPDAGALRDDLSRVLAGEPPRARVRATSTGRRLVGAAIAIGACAGLGLAILAGTTGARPAPTPEPAASRNEGLAAQAMALRLTDPRRALTLLADALGESPDRHEWRLHRGLLHWGVGEGATARAEWARVPRGAPEFPRARLYAGLERLAAAIDVNGDLDAEGVAALRDVARAGGPEADLALAIDALLEKQWDAARARLEGKPGWEALMLRASVEDCDERGERTVAIRCYTEVLSAGIPLAWVYFNRATARREIGDFSGALEDLALGMHIAPDDPSFLVSRGVTRQMAGDVADGRADVEAGLRLAPQHAEGLRVRGQARANDGDLTGAIADFEAALRSRPCFAEAYNDLAKALRELGNLPGSLDACDRGLALQPRLAALSVNRGVARHGLGDMEGARADFDRAVALDPKDATAWGNRSVARRSQGDLAGALEDLDRALALRPDYVTAVMNRGLVRRDLRDLGAASADFAHAARLEPANRDAHGYLALCRLALEDWPGAASAFRAMLVADPDYADADAVRRHIADCEARARAAADGGR